MSGIYTKTSELLISKAEIDTFTSKQLPPLIDCFREFHVEVQEKGVDSQPAEISQIDETETQLIDITADLPSEIKTHTDNARKPIDNNNSSSSRRGVPNEKMMFVKFNESRMACDWDDAGSQTDHSDLSEGHYSDETSEEKSSREHRNRKKSEKRTRRIADLNKKYNIND